MDDVTHLGLDVHKETIAVAILRPGDRDPDERVIPNTPEALKSLIRTRRSSGPLVACYEAGPTGYETYRLMTDLGVPCDVIAPTLIPRRAGRRVKTDRLDARNLARLHRAGELTSIRVPTLAEEALRDLVRVREDLKDDRRDTMRRVKSFLLRQGRRYPGQARGWTTKYDKWVHAQHFEEPAAEAAFRHYVATLDARGVELRAIDAEIEAACGRPPMDAAIGRLRCFRGIDSVSAVTIAAEVCDFHRFATATQFMAFTGLIPTEHSSGATERRGSITKTGNAHLRRVLVEAAWSYRHRPGIGIEHRRRSEGQPPDVRAYAWAAQLRLCARFRSLSLRRQHNVAVVAVARELGGFVWGMMTDRLAVA
jgi:transposase